MKVRIITENAQSKVNLSATLQKTVERAIRAALRYEGVTFPCEISLTFTDNRKIHKLNKEFRGIDRATDVLSFPMFDDISEADESTVNVLGDIVISLEKAKKQAEEYGHGLYREASFLAVHSVLHLLGYDHERSEEEEKTMFAKQEEILEKMGLGRK